MAFFMAALLIVSCAGMRISGPGRFNNEYLDKKSTTAVNGIFVILVIFSHFYQYADFSSICDLPYTLFRKHIDQMVVAPFLFYSGFGMMEAIRSRGSVYIRKIPSKFWKLLLRMEIAVILYLMLSYALGITFPLERILLSFTLWLSVGNSNWYIFAVLGLYILIWLSFRISSRIMPGPASRSSLDSAHSSPTGSAGRSSHGSAAEISAAGSDGIYSRNGRITGIAILFILSAGFVYILMRAGRPAYCYNTIMIMPLGFLYSEFRREAESVFRRSGLAYLIVLICVLAVYIVSFRYRKEYGIEGYTVWAAAFTAMLILITSKVSIYNRVLEWFGKHVFSIYILQRLPMIALDHFGCIEQHPYISLIAAIAVTLPLALIFEKGTDALINAISKAAAGCSSTRKAEKPYDHRIRH